MIPENWVKPILEDVNICIMSTPDWAVFKRKIYINAPLAQVYKAWATSEGLKDWFLEDAAYLDNGTERDSTQLAQKGDEYRFDWYH